MRISTERSLLSYGFTMMFLWQIGISTVGIDKESIKKYIQDQWKKDKFNDGDQLDLRWG